MDKRKITTIILATVVFLVIVVGTFAFFTSKDIAINNFTIGGNSNGANTGVEVKEDFIQEDADNTTIDTPVKKNVWVENKANYEQYIRVKFEKVWKIEKEDGKYKEVTHYKRDGNRVLYANENDKNTDPDYKEIDSTWSRFDDKLIQLIYNDEALNSTNWTLAKDENDNETILDTQWHYYNYIVPVDGRTTNIIDKVSLSSEANSCYNNVKFDVIVVAEGVQASGVTLNNKPKDWNIPDYAIGKYKEATR